MNAMRRKWGACALASGLAATMWPGVSPSAEADEPPTTTTSSRRTPAGMLVSGAVRGDTEVTVFGGRLVTMSESGSATAEAVAVRVAPDLTTAERQIQPTVYEMTLAAGFSAAEACDFARGMDQYGCTTSAQVSAATPAGRVQAGRDRYVDKLCFLHRTYKGDGHKDNYLCNVRYLLHRPKKYYVVIGNKMKATASTHDPGTLYDRLTGSGVQAAYDWSNAHAIDWSPFGTSNVGRCRQFSTTATARNGVAVTSSGEVCPDKVVPWHSPRFQYFGSKWKGGPSRDERGVVASSATWTSTFERGYRLVSYLDWN